MVLIAAIVAAGIYYIMDNNDVIVRPKEPIVFPNYTLPVEDIHPFRCYLVCPSFDALDSSCHYVCTVKK